MEKREPISTVKNRVAGSVPFNNKLNLIGRQCANIPASNRDSFLWRDICVSSNLLNRTIGTM
jgi:hypothetical protein